MAQVDEYMDKLHDKFFHGTITEEERLELYSHYKDFICHGPMDETLIGEFLTTSHPEYGKPDKNGTITIV